MKCIIQFVERYGHPKLLNTEMRAKASVFAIVPNLVYS
jgi:hypothetical protein